MRIHATDSPGDYRARHSYSPLIAALQATTGWVAVLAADVAGKSKVAKQTSIHQAARQQGMLVETRYSGDEILVREKALSREARFKNDAEVL